MATSNTPIYPQSIVNAAVNIVSTGSATPVSLITAGTNGTKIDFINAFTTDTAANTVSLYLYNGSTTFQLSTFTVAAGAGNTGSVPAVSILNNTQIPSLQYDSNGNKYLYLAPTWSLYVSAVAVTAAKTLTISVQAENF